MSWSVVIAEDYKMVREVFTTTVENAPAYRLAGAYATATEAAEHCLAFPVDLLLLDVLFPGGISGLEAARIVKARQPETKIIIVTSMPELSFLRRAREIGVESFWYKEVQEQPLLEIMDRTMAGQSVYPDAPPPVAVGNASSADFTEREAAVLRELVSGAGNREIAACLGIAENTVKMHISNMLQKTGFHSRLVLAVKARHLGIAIKE